MQGNTGERGADVPWVQDLLRAVDAAYAPWLRSRLRVVAGRDDASFDAVVDEASAWVRTELAALLAADVEEQRANPLQLLRDAARFATPVLESLGVPAPERDEFESRAMPGDTYGIGPIAWMDLGEDVHEAGISWGAWKAATVISRHRAEGN